MIELLRNLFLKHNSGHVKEAAKKLNESMSKQERSSDNLIAVIEELHKRLSGEIETKIKGNVNEKS